MLIFIDNVMLHIVVMLDATNTTINNIILILVVILIIRLFLDLHHGGQRIAMRFQFGLVHLR